MIKFISSEKYAKLIGYIDYWNCQALQQKHWHEFYKGKAYSLLKENESLKQRIKDLDKEEVFEDFENFCEDDFYNLLKGILKDIKKFPELPVLHYWKNKLSEKGYKIRINEMNDSIYRSYYIWSIEKNYNTIVEYREFK